MNRIYINGLDKKPEHCTKCPICDEIDDCGLQYEWFKTLEEQFAKCPLVEEDDRPSEWIPCSERLPSNFSEGETVLATTDVDGDRVIAMFALDVKSFYLKGHVSAWMPLPEPWRGDRR